MPGFQFFVSSPCECFIRTTSGFDVYQSSCVLVIVNACDQWETNRLCVCGGGLIRRTIRVARMACVSPATNFEMQSLSNHLRRWWRSCGRRGRNASPCGSRVFGSRGAALDTNCSISFCRCGVDNRIVALQIAYDSHSRKQPEFQKRITLHQPHLLKPH